jgi:hypothetical protein
LLQWRCWLVARRPELFFNTTEYILTTFECDTVKFLKLFFFGVCGEAESFCVLYILGFLKACNYRQGKKTMEMLPLKTHHNNAKFVNCMLNIKPQNEPGGEEYWEGPTPYDSPECWCDWCDFQFNKDWVFSCIGLAGSERLPCRFARIQDCACILGGQARVRMFQNLFAQRDMRFLRRLCEEKKSGCQQGSHMCSRCAFSLMCPYL